jgi:hypothetical protein
MTNKINSPEARARSRARLEGQRAEPGFEEKRIATIKANFAERWADPAYREAHMARLAAAKHKRLVALRKYNLERWADPAEREKYSQIMKAKWESGEHAKHITTERTPEGRASLRQWQAFKAAKKRGFAVPREKMAEYQRLRYRKGFSAQDAANILGIANIPPNHQEV